jgi:hypothetical protein
MVATLRMLDVDNNAPATRIERDVVAKRPAATQTLSAIDLRNFVRGAMVVRKGVAAIAPRRGPPITPGIKSFKFRG